METAKLKPARVRAPRLSKKERSRRQAAAARAVHYRELARGYAADGRHYDADTARGFAALCAVDALGVRVIVGGRARAMKLWPLPLDCDNWDNAGCTVQLRYGAESHEVEAALAAVGLYAPRGLDTLVWGACPDAAATIFDSAGNPIVHLLEVAP
jgi:hypothetical protein